MSSVRNREWFETLAGTASRNASRPWGYFQTVNGAYHRRRTTELVQAIDDYLRSGSTILDVGSGSGSVAAELETRGHTVIGLDHIAIDRLGPASQVIGDGRRLPLAEDSVDAVLLCEVVYYFGDDDRLRLIAEARRILRSDGYVLVSQRHAFRQLAIPPAALGLRIHEICADFWSLGRPERLLHLPVYWAGSSSRVASILETHPWIEGLLAFLLSPWSAQVFARATARLGSTMRRWLPARWLRSSRIVVARPTSDSGSTLAVS